MENALANSIPISAAISPEAGLVDHKALVERGLETPLIHNGLGRD